MLAHQLRDPKPAAHSAKRKEFMVRLRRGLRPMKKWRTMVTVRATTVRVAAAENYSSIPLVCCLTSSEVV